MSSSDYKHMLKIMLFPMAVGWLGLLLFKKFVVQKHRETEE